VIGRDLVLVQFLIGQILRAGSADGSSALSANELTATIFSRRATTSHLRRVADETAAFPAVRS